MSWWELGIAEVVKLLACIMEMVFELFDFLKSFGKQNNAVCLEAINLSVYQGFTVHGIVCWHLGLLYTS